MTSVNQKTMTFLKEWTDKEFKTIKQAIKKHFLFKAFRTTQGTKTLYTYADIENLLGLPYTSSSSFAGVWVTNSEVYSPKYPELHYVGFAIGDDTKPYAILWDNEENETLLPL
jgi:hypothetical protein